MTASDSSISEAITTLIAEVTTNLMKNASDETEGNEDIVPEAPLDGKPTKEQLARIQSEIDDALDHHAILLYTQDTNGCWSIGIVSLITTL